MTNQKHGVSALGLQRLLGLGSYQTAWTILQKLRTAMVRPGRDRLHGSVEVDETYIGGIEHGVRGRGTDTKFIVVIAIEVLSPKGFGRVRLQRVSDVSGASLVPFVTAAVESGAEVCTDGWRGYYGLSGQGYRHQRINISSSGDPAHVLLPGVHSVASLLKRWLLGTHQGSVTVEHLDAYLNEFAFRFNRRHSRRRGLLFLRLLQHAVVTPTDSVQAVAISRKNGKPQPVVGTVLRQLPHLSTLLAYNGDKEATYWLYISERCKRCRQELQGGSRPGVLP
jgi:transposase-like protein